MTSPIRKNQKAEANQTWKAKNKDRNKAINKAWGDRNPEKRADAQRKMRYGLSPDDFKTLLEKQDGKCAVCNGVNQLINGTPRRLAIDHDKATKKIRGLLCDRCNVGIGHLKHDCELLRKAIAYLEAAS